MNTPLYNELVKKYYLCRGVIPFSYPEQPVVIDYLPLMESNKRESLSPSYFNLRN